MLFSVMVPVYNVNKYLRQCIESVVNQSYKNIELILVDDGSTDNSGAICDEYANRYENIKVFHKPNQGLLHTRRFALRNATGEWYVFLDSDDYLQTDAIQTIYETICKYDCDCVIYKLQHVFNGKVLDAVDSFSPVEDVVIEDKKSLYKLAFSDWTYNSLCRKACKATLFDGRDYSEYYGVKHAEDLLQSLEIFENSTKTVVVDKILYNYTANMQSISHDFNLDNYELIFLPPEKALQLIERDQVFSHSDFVDMYSAHLRMFMETIGQICCSTNTVKQKVDFFKRTENCDYYKRLKRAYKNNMITKDKKRFLFGFYSKGCYRTYLFFFRKYASFCKMIGR